MSKLHPPVSANDHTRGSKTPQLQIVEFGDFQCPYCGAAEPIVEKIFQKFGSIVSITFRNFPLSDVHPMAYSAACFAEAAALQDKYWEMHDAIYAHQDRLSREYLLEIGKNLKLDLDKLSTDADSEAIKALVDDDFENGAESGVNGTPCFFIDGQRFNGGADDLYELLLENVEK